MQNKNLLLIISGLIILLIIAGVSAATPPTMMTITIKIKPIAPYDDDAFKNLTYPVIEGLSTSELTSEERTNLQSVYYDAAKMSVSKKFFPVALNITKLLFYLVSSDEAYDEYKDGTGIGAFNEGTRKELLDQSKADKEVAVWAWNGLKNYFPNTTITFK